MITDHQEQRIRRIERTNRVLLLLVTSLIAALAALGATRGPESPGVIRANAIEIVDSEGEVRVTVGTIDEETGIFVHDTEGRLRLTATHHPDQTALFIRDETETVRVGAAQFAHGGGGFALHGPSSKGAVTLPERPGISVVL